MCVSRPARPQRAKRTPAESRGGSEQQASVGAAAPLSWRKARLLRRCLGRRPEQLLLRGATLGASRPTELAREDAIRTASGTLKRTAVKWEDGRGSSPPGPQQVARRPMLTRALHHPDFDGGWRTEEEGPCGPTGRRPCHMLGYPSERM